ncbi:carbohydrate ABC transporter permease [Paenibacillus selenitireducens]|uniref:carbohydrate ABC transporter permease n=1 Tax=Paenibacillus selenitireducens TaxID=1324314 RepID=UPI00117C7397|nr:carbohydrate ABC transporter permease [Paenibacillus selenitireducens]
MVKIVNVFKYIFLTIAATVTIWPILFVVLGSFKTNQELIAGGGLLPKKWMVSNYAEVWGGMDFSFYFFNSFVFACIAAILSALLGSMGGYVFARSDFPGKRLLYALVIGLLFISLGPMTLFPKFEMAVNWGLNSNIFTLPLLTATGLGASLFLYEGYIKSLGREIDEAAVVDGAGYYKRYFSIFLPLMIPIISTFFIIEFVAEWNNYIFPLVMTIGNPQLKTITVAVVEMRSMGDGAAAWNLLMTGSSISIIPVLIVFVVMNRQIVEGLSQGAVKG